MNKDYKLWQDFNNISVEVKIDKVNYNAILYVENEMLKLKVDCTKNVVLIVSYPFCFAYFAVSSNLTL